MLAGVPQWKWGLPLVITNQLSLVLCSWFAWRIILVHLSICQLCWDLLLSLPSEVMEALTTSSHAIVGQYFTLTIVCTCSVAGLWDCILCYTGIIISFIFVVYMYVYCAYGISWCHLWRDHWSDLLLSNQKTRCSDGLCTVQPETFWILLLFCVDFVVWQSKWSENDVFVGGCERLTSCLAVWFMAIQEKRCHGGVVG